MVYFQVFVDGKPEGDRVLLHDLQVSRSIVAHHMLTESHAQAEHREKDARVFVLDDSATYARELGLKPKQKPKSFAGSADDWRKKEGLS